MQEDLEKYRPQAQEVARFCERWGMVYEELLGSESFIQRITKVIEMPAALAEDFVIIPPNSISKQEDFRYQPQDLGI